MALNVTNQLIRRVLPSLHLKTHATTVLRYLLLSPYNQDNGPSDWLLPVHGPGTCQSLYY